MADIRKERWKPEEDEKIEHMQIIYGNKWTKVLANAFPTRSNEAIRKRWHAKSKQLWSISEDKQLITVVNGAHFETRADMKEWCESASVSIPNKNTNQCIDHWFSLLSPSQTARRWKNEEDKKLIALCSSFGNRWKLIAQYFPRRSNNTIRKRWHVINKIKGSDTGEIKNSYKNTTSIATALLKLYSTSLDSSITREVPPKVSILTKKADVKMDIHESKVCNRVEINDLEALIKAVNENIKNIEKRSTWFSSDSESLTRGPNNAQELSPTQSLPTKTAAGNTCVE